VAEVPQVVENKAAKLPNEGRSPENWETAFVFYANFLVKNGGLNKVKFRP